MADPPPYSDADLGSEIGPAPSTPRWVKVFGIAFLLLVLLIVIMMASGHGPGRHMSGGIGDELTSFSVAE